MFISFASVPCDGAKSGEGNLRRVSAMKLDSQGFGVTIILCGAVLIGLMPAFATFAYLDGANVLLVLLARSVIGVVILLAFIRVTGRRAGITADRMWRALPAGIAHVFSAIGLLGSIVYVDISLANIILFLYPFPIAVIGHFRGDSPLTPLTVGLMLLATLGLTLVLGVDFHSVDMRGIALAFMGMIAFTFMILSMSELTRAVGAPISNLLMTLWAVVIFAAAAIVGPLSGLLQTPALPQTLFGWASVGVVGATFAIGYLCFFVSANIIGAARASLLSIAEPVMIILFAVILVGETLLPMQWIGIALVFGSLLATELARKPKQRPSQ